MKKIKQYFILAFILLLMSSLSGYSQQAYITGSGVLIRSDHSTSGAKKGSLKLNQEVDILDVYYPSNNYNEAILRTKTPFYDSDGNGSLVFSLDAGKAVKVIENIDQDQYRISFKNPNGSIGFAKISSSSLDFINGEKWYKVKTNGGLVGWVFGKYVQELYSSLSGYSQQGSITGSGVSIRSDHSISSAKRGSLKLNEEVDIIDVYYPSNNYNEALLRTKTNFYDRDGNGSFVFSLDVGKAVKVEENIDQDQYRISFKHLDGSTGFAKISSNSLEFINGEKWYKVRTNSGLVGWVFGKYVKELY